MWVAVRVVKLIKPHSSERLGTKMPPKGREGERETGRDKKSEEEKEKEGEGEGERVKHTERQS